MIGNIPKGPEKKETGHEVWCQFQFDTSRPPVTGNYDCNFCGNPITVTITPSTESASSRPLTPEEAERKYASGFLTGGQLEKYMEEWREKNKK